MLRKLHKTAATLIVVAAFGATSTAIAADNAPELDACYRGVETSCAERLPDASPSDQAFQECLTEGRAACDRDITARASANQLQLANPPQPQLRQTQQRPAATAVRR